MRKGFTLIEILVAVLIMGILASVAAPQYMISVNKARATEAMNLLSAVVAAQELWYDRKLAYTPDVNELPVDFQKYSGFQYAKPWCTRMSDGLVRTCFTATDKYGSDHIPMFEFHLLNGGPENIRGKRWCIAEADDNIATAVCSSLGTYDMSGTDHLGKACKYYEIDRQKI